jgi:DNA adenine methylase
LGAALIRVITSNRAVSLQTVAKDIAKVGSELKLDIQWFDRLFLPYDIRTAGDSVVIVMPVDVLYVQPYLLLCRDLKRGGIKNIYYATIEGNVDRRYIHSWMKEVDFIANSHYTREKLVDAGFRVLDVVHHGVDLRDVERARRMMSVGAEYMMRHGINPSKHVVVLTIANSHPRKGLAWYDRVVEEVGKRDASVKFLVITEEKGLGYFKNRYNLVVTKDFGKLPRLTILSLIASAHILAVPSLAEGFGLPVLESMALGTPCIHSELPPLMEFSKCFTTPVREVLYFDKAVVGPSGIIFEHHMWDAVEFAERLLQIIDYYRNKKDVIIDYRYRAWEQAKKLSIHRTYPKLLKYLADGIPSEIDDGIAIYEIEKLPETPPAATPVATVVEPTPQPAEATISAVEAVGVGSVDVALDLDTLAKEILSGVDTWKPTKPIQYPGGDWFIRNHIIDLLAKSGCTTLVEVFGGSGVISMYAPRDKFKAIIYNDIDDLLVNFFTVLKEKPHELMKRLALTPISRSIFNKYIDVYRSGEIHKLDPVEKAAVFFFINRTSMFGQMGQFGVEITRSMAKKVKRAVVMLEEYAKMWSDIVIENRDFRQIIKLYDRPYTVFYCDPPFLTGKARDRERYYRFSFTEDDMKDLLNLLSNIKGRFVLKLPYDHLEIDYISEWVNRYRVKEIEHPHNMYKVIGGERPKFKTLLIYNYDV